MKTIPNISKELIAYLEKICPDQSPSIDAVERKIWFAAGKVDLVRHLRSVHDQQNETLIEGH